MAETITGLALVIASACVFNNYIDKDIDKKMFRTRKRALVLQEISESKAIAYGCLLGSTGFFILLISVSTKVVGLAFLAWFWYIVLYGWAKRRSVYGTLVGSVPGALPPVIGYVSASDRIDGAAWLLFLILAAWQMPHFYAIAMYRYKDYKAASLPVLTVRRGMHSAQRQIIIYIGIFTLAVSGLAVFGYTGYIYLLLSVGLGVWWFWQGTYRLKGLNYEKWGRKMFFYSLFVNLGISILIAAGAFLP